MKASRGHYRTKAMGVLTAPSRQPLPPSQHDKKADYAVIINCAAKGQVDNKYTAIPTWLAGRSPSQAAEADKKPGYPLSTAGFEERSRSGGTLLLKQGQLCPANEAS